VLDLISLVKGKLVGNSRAILQSDLPKVAGPGCRFFLVVPRRVKNPAVRPAALFPGLLPVFDDYRPALGRTALRTIRPIFNSENFLVAFLAPLVIVTGHSLFFLLLEQIALPFSNSVKSNRPVRTVRACRCCWCFCRANSPLAYPRIIRRGSTNLGAGQERMIDDERYSWGWRGTARLSVCG